MNKLALLLIAVAIMLAVPLVSAVGNSVSTNISVGTEDFAPLIWMNPDSRLLLRNPATGGTELIERVNNYAFEGEQIVWEVLVWIRLGLWNDVLQ